MKRANNIAFARRIGLTAALLMLCTAAPLRAQTLRNSADSRTSVNLGFTGIVRNSIMLTITGAGTTTVTAQTNAISPVAASGTIAFGNFSSLLQPAPTNGTGYRVALPSPGAVVAATLDAIVTYNGAQTASIAVARRVLAGSVANDLPLANLRIASPALATWTSGAQGAQVPNAGSPGYNICTAAGDLTCVNGKVYNHNLAIFVPDTQPAGAFSTTVVYTGTMP